MNSLNGARLVGQRIDMIRIRVTAVIAAVCTLLFLILPASSCAQTSSSAKNSDKNTVLALRTNLLLPALNVGVEVPLGNHWSVGADYYYPWIWRNSDHKNCFQGTFFSGEARYWFGKNRTKGRRLTGHSVAAYGAWGYYDIERNWTGHQGDFSSVGVDYLFALPIAKNKLHLEFQLAGGYLFSKAQPYDVYYKGGNLIRRKGVHKNFKYLGPTKVGVTLVLPIKMKGGSK